MMMQHSNDFPRRVLFSICGYLLLVLLGAVKVQAATYYVSLSGSDSNSGTSSSPFKTFAKALKPLKPGDTLYIRAGTWTQQLDLMANKTSGTSSAYIKIAGYPGEKVTIRYADPTEASYGPIKARGETHRYLIFENLVLDGSNTTNKTNWQIRGGNHHFILRNLEIKNFKATGLFIVANDVQVINCTIHDQITVGTSRHYGIYLGSGSNVMIQGTRIYNNPGGGIHVYNGPISNLTIRNNALYNNNGMSSSSVGGILVWGKSSSIISSTKIYNNLSYKNGTSSGSGPASGILVGPYTSGTKVWNNTVYGNKGYGVQIGFDTTTKSTVVQNNISYGNGKGNYINKGSSTTYTNNVTTDPKFVSVSSNNFQLQSSSPAANKGVNLSSVPNDYRNVARPKGASHDIGGYENY